MGQATLTLHTDTNMPTGQKYDVALKEKRIEVSIIGTSQNDEKLLPCIQDRRRTHWIDRFPQVWPRAGHLVDPLPRERKVQC